MFSADIVDSVVPPTCHDQTPTAIQQFPVRIPIQPYESGKAYLLRVAGKLGFNNLNHLLRFIGITWSDLYKQEVLPVLSHLLRLESSQELAQHFFIHGETQKWSSSVTLLGHEVPIAHLNKTSCRICPRCLAEMGGCTVFWELAYVTVCPHHRCKLVDHCSYCGEPISWFRPGLTACLCGHDLRQEKVIPANWHVVEYTKLIYSAYGFEFGRKNSKKVLPFPELYEQDLNFLLALIPLMTSADKITNVSVPIAHLQSGTVAENYRALAKVAKILAQWPYAWIKHVALYIPMPAMLRRGHIEIHVKCYGTILYHMGFYASEKVMAILRRPIEDFIAQIPEYFSVDEFHRHALPIIQKCRGGVN